MSSRDTVQTSLIGEVGSTAHGLNTPESDRDLMGLFFETPEQLLGIAPAAESFRDRPRGEGEKTQTGDVEYSFHPIRKYASLAAQREPDCAHSSVHPVPGTGGHHRYP